MKFLFALTLLVLSAGARAEEAQPAPVSETPSAASEADVRNKDETWYFNFGIGLAATPDYGSVTNAAIDNLKAVGTNYSRIPLTIDIGFLFPLSDKSTVIGASLFGAADTIEANGYKISIVQSFLAFTAIHYFGENVGDGVFVRGDVGPARYSVDAKNPSGTSYVTEHSDWGVGEQIGVGYSLPTSPDARIALGLFFTNSKVKDDKAHYFSLQISGLL